MSRTAALADARRVARWQLAVLALLTIAACQFALHTLAFVILPSEAWSDGLAVLSVFFGLPVAFCYGVLIWMMATSWYAGATIPGRVFTTAAWYVLGLAVVFSLCAAIKVDPATAMLWLMMLPLSCAFGIILVPFAASLYVGWPAWRLFAFLGMGALSVLPIAIVLWRTRSRADAAHPSPH
jgi:hypothetical protein